MRKILLFASMGVLVTVTVSYAGRGGNNEYLDLREDLEIRGRSQVLLTLDALQDPILSNLAINMLPITERNSNKFSSKFYEAAALRCLIGLKEKYSDGRDVYEGTPRRYLLSNLGIASLNLGEYGDSIVHLNSALKLLDKEIGEFGSNVKDRASLYNFLGQGHEGLYSYETAQGFYKQALAVKTSLSEPVLTGEERESVINNLLRATQKIPLPIITSHDPFSFYNYYLKQEVRRNPFLQPILPPRPDQTQSDFAPKKKSILCSTQPQISKDRDERKTKEALKKTWGMLKKIWKEHEHDLSKEKESAPRNTRKRSIDNISSKKLAYGEPLPKKRKKNQDEEKENRRNNEEVKKKRTSKKNPRSSDLITKKPHTKKVKVFQEKEMKTELLRSDKKALRNHKGIGKKESRLRLL